MVVFVSGFLRLREQILFIFFVIHDQIALDQNIHHDVRLHRSVFVSMADKLIKMKRMCNLHDNVMFPLVILQLNFTSTSHH